MLKRKASKEEVIVELTKGMAIHLFSLGYESVIIAKVLNRSNATISRYLSQHKKNRQSKKKNR